MTPLILLADLLLTAGAAQGGTFVDDFEDVSAWSMPGQAIRPASEGAALEHLLKANR